MIERVQLFYKRDSLSFLVICLFILCYSLLIEYNNYKNFTRFDNQLISATILKQYEKTKNSRTYQVLKLRSEDGLTFYSSAKKSLTPSIGKKITLEVWGGKISFYEYLTSFYAYTKIKHIDTNKTLKQKLNSFVFSQHNNTNIINIYQALFSAKPLNQNLQTAFSNLGVSHLLAISGFHLGVISALIFFIFRPIYSFFQNRYFPYRNSKADLFIFVSILLLSYLLFLDSPPSLLRSFTMLIIGFILYDRGIKIISMQTLFLSVVLLLVFFPRLSFTLGFWLSVSGVFYIFLFLLHFKDINKIWQFILVPFWVYILMLPFSLSIFSNYSIYHPLSILWTTLFTLFYPLSIFLHLINFGGVFDTILESFVALGENGQLVILSYTFLLIHVALSLLSMYKKIFVYLLLTFSLSILIYTVNQITYL